MTVFDISSERLFKFLDADGRPAHGGTGRWFLPAGKRPGDWMPIVEGKLKPCENGYHLCRPGDLAWWPTAHLYEAGYRGDRINANGYQGKIVVREARLSRRIETWTEQTVRLWACDCAEHVLHFYEERYPGDTRPREAIRVGRLAALGQASEEEVAWAAEVARAAWAAWAAEATRAAEAARAAWAARAARADWVAEAAWQSERLLAYLDDTVTLQVEEGHRPMGHYPKGAPQ